VFLQWVVVAVRKNSAYRSGCHNYSVFNNLLKYNGRGLHNGAHFSGGHTVARVKGDSAGFTQVSSRRTRRGPKAISLPGRFLRTGIRTRARSCHGTRAGCWE